MKSEDILLELNIVFADILKIKDILLKKETTASDIESWDSISNILLIDSIETHFNINFSLMEIQSFNNVGDICESISKKVD